jgi:ketosteroid isomerase-like protein
LKKPVVGNEPRDEVPGPGSLSNRVPNTTRMTTTIRKIEVAKAGDLTYEFSDAIVSYEAQGGVPTSFPTSLLRVWKKDAGEWKLAAFFIRPHDTDAGD